MDKGQLLTLLNRKHLEINLPFVEAQITAKLEEIKSIERKIREFISSYLTSVADSFATDRYQRWFINHKIFKKNRVEKISARLLEELYEETQEEYFLWILKHRKLNDSLKRYQLLQRSVDARGRILPEFAINTAQSIYTAKPALRFSIQELERILNAKSHYCETLDEALQFISTSSDIELIAVIKTTVYYRELITIPETCEHGKKQKAEYEKDTKYGYLRIDFQEIKLVEQQINFEALFAEENLEYWMTKLIHTALTENMQLKGQRLFRHGQILGCIFIVHDDKNRFVIRLHANSKGKFQFNMQKNPDPGKTVENVLGCSKADEVFRSAFKIKEAYRKRMELERLASSGDLVAWDIICKLYEKMMSLNVNEIDFLRFVQRLWLNRSPSTVLYHEFDKGTDVAKYYVNLQSQIHMKEMEIQMGIEEIKKRKEWADSLWGDSEQIRQLKAKMNAEIQEMETEIEKKANRILSLRREAEQIERSVENSIHYLLKQIASKYVS